MAEFARVNPVATTLDYEEVGKDIDFFTIDFINAVNGSAGPNGAQAAVFDTIMTTATIIAVGPLGNSNTEVTFGVEGSGTIVAGTLQTAIRALGTVDSIDLSGATVTAKNLVIAA
tara:strand:+ start:2868 stop:3212 length:345 start_codon:yes stop_codon:yes gene_type:complete